uniref:Rieske domain-containing protein n=1 Tax=Castor canadensis TaxID=51338 RepID=A0A8C0XHK4_CASCN
MSNRSGKSNCNSFEIPRSQETMDSLKQTTEILLCLSPVEVDSLKEGINFFRNKSTGKDYILYKNKKHLKACKNLCKHQGGLFIKDIEDLDGRVWS